MNSMRALLYLALAAQNAHEHHVPKNASEYAKILNDPERDAWQKPHEVVMALKLRPDEVIADIGAGTGYFTARFARHAAKAYAVDIDSQLLEMAKKDAPPNLEAILALPDDPKLAPGSVDTIFFCDVLHHIGNRAAYYEKLKLALKPGGRVVVIDFYKTKLAVGPPPEMKIDGSEVVREFKSAGFRQTNSWKMLEYQYFYEFRLN